MKLVAESGEVYIYAQSHDRVLKERAMRRRQMRWSQPGVAQDRADAVGNLGAAEREVGARAGQCGGETTPPVQLEAEVAPLASGATNK